MSIDRIVEQIPADVTGLIQLPLERGPGNYLLFVTSAANVTIQLLDALGGGVRETFAAVNGGVYVRRVKPWGNMRIDGPIGTVCTYFYGNADTDRDETDIRQQVAVISGVTATADQPAVAITDKAPVAVPNAAQTNIFGVNNSRRRISFSFASNAVIPPATVFARKAGGVNNLFEIQPGVVYNDAIFAGIDIRNDSGGALSALIYEVS